jgi:uncharacterized SAM-binding protein YcdF (DUF218 family)
MGFFRTVGLLLLITILLCAAFARQAARFLVVDEPMKSDAIVVLAGETNTRPEEALKLLNEGIARHVFLDAEERNLIYDEQLVDIAHRYIEKRGDEHSVSVCVIIGSSTFAEVRDVDRCLQSMNAHRVLIVTSDFHTRRAGMIFRHGLPQYEIHTAAARNEFQFGEKWWTNREWAKTTFDEWLKMIWWELVDRWRK